MASSNVEVRVNNGVCFSLPLSSPVPAGGWKPKQFLFIRHGESEYNAYRTPGQINRCEKDTVVASLLDSVLSQNGEAQAAALATKLLESTTHVQLLVSSPLRRALQTSIRVLPVLGAANHVLLAELAEERHAVCDVGVVDLAASIRSVAVAGERAWDRSHLDELAWNASNARAFASLPNFVKEDNESAARRVQAAWQWLLARDEDVIAVVGHGGIMRKMLRLDAKQPGYNNCDCVFVTCTQKQ
jgi:broad specificity phosphatase PhoE